jgi:hypothetical protein
MRQRQRKDYAPFMLIVQELRPWVAEVARRVGLQGMRTLLDKKVSYLSVGSNADNATIAIDGDPGPLVQNFCCLTGGP